MLNIRARLQSPPRGLSLVELMVGITIGLFVVAAASIVVTTQLRENRQLLAETQLQQDLRAGADILAREIRRTGYSNVSETSIWNPTNGAPAASPYQGLEVVAGSVTYHYRRASHLTGPFRYWVDNGVIKTQMDPAIPAQELTDKNVLFVEVLNIVLASSTPVRLECPNDCPPSAPPGLPNDYCWPTTAVRDITVTITGRAVSDPSVRRTINSQVRLRNDYVVFNAAPPIPPIPPGAPSPPSPPSPPVACPE